MQTHSPIDAGADSLPGPDVAVVSGPIEAFDDRHPRGDELALVAELSVSSHTIDRAKVAVYARARVPVYWHVDLVEGCITVFSSPTRDAASAPSGAAADAR